MDATLGHKGTPQSGTGQTSLLTGQNGADLFGRHFGPWVPTALRPIVREENLLVHALAADHSVAFANAYPADWPGDQRRRRVAGPPLAAQGAGLLTRSTDHLARGEALASEILNDGWIRHLGPDDLPRPTAREAGATLAAISAGHDLTLYAHYATDTAGHTQTMEAGVVALERVDAFLGGVVKTLPDDHHLLVVSDHGNLEDIRGGHTRNPALGLAFGPRASQLSERITSLTDIPGAVLELLGS